MAIKTMGYKKTYAVWNKQGKRKRNIQNEHSYNANEGLNNRLTVDVDTIYHYIFSFLFLY